MFALKCFSAIANRSFTCFHLQLPSPHVNYEWVKKGELVFCFQRQNLPKCFSCINLLDSVHDQMTLKYQNYNKITGFAITQRNVLNYFWELLYVILHTILCNIKLKFLITSELIYLLTLLCHQNSFYLQSNFCGVRPC